MRDILNEIARELLCPLSKTLAIDPVLCEDGLVYEKEAIETLRSKSDRFCVPLISRTPFHPTLSRIVEILVSSGEINGEYLGGWADTRPARFGSASVVEEVIKFVEEGEKILSGTVVHRDEEKAYAYFESASEEGVEMGTIRKAECLLTGTGVKKDHAEGHQILVEAAQSYKSGETSKPCNFVPCEFHC